MDYDGHGALERLGPGATEEVPVVNVTELLEARAREYGQLIFFKCEDRNRAVEKVRENGDGVAVELAGWGPQAGL